MTPVITAVRMNGAAHRARLPLLVLGPSLGTSATTLWTACAGLLTDAFDVLAWDLPGHGHNRSVPEDDLSVADLARGVLAVVEEVLDQRGEAGATFDLAGVSLGGAVGLQLLLDAPQRVRSAVLVCTGARIGDAETWSGRIERVRAGGTAGLVGETAGRWFAPGWVDREPERSAALLRALAATADDGYVAACRALAGFDVRDRLGEVAVPVLTVAGADDPVTPPASLEEVARGVRHGEAVVLDDVAHLAPAEAPDRVAALLRRHLLGEEAPGDLAGLVASLGWEPVGLDPRTAALVSLAAVVGRGGLDEVTAEVRAARAAGVSDADVVSCLVRAAAHTELAVADAVLRAAVEELAGEDAD